MEQMMQPVWAALDDGVHKRPDASVPLFLQRFSAGWLATMMATAGVSLLERRKEYAHAVERLQQLLGEHSMFKVQQCWLWTLQMLTTSSTSMMRGCAYSKYEPCKMMFALGWVEHRSLRLQCTTCDVVVTSVMQAACAALAGAV